MCENKCVMIQNSFNINRKDSVHSDTDETSALSRSSLKEDKKKRKVTGKEYSS